MLPHRVLNEVQTEAAEVRRDLEEQLRAGEKKVASLQTAYDNKKNEAAKLLADVESSNKKLLELERRGNERDVCGSACHTQHRVGLQ